MKVFKDKKMIKRHATTASLLIASVAAALVALSATDAKPNSRAETKKAEDKQMMYSASLPTRGSSPTTNTTSLQR